MTHLPDEHPSLLVVNADVRVMRWLERLATNSHLFRSVRSKADGRFAFEYVWHCLEQDMSTIPDIIIVDVRLPGLNGIQLTRELRRYEELRKIFIAFVSSSRDSLDQDAAENAGCDFFVRRPRSLDGLSKVLKSIANRWVTSRRYHRVLA